MSTTLEAARPSPRSRGTVAVGGRDYIIERPSARKSSSAFRLLRAVSATVKAVTAELGKFDREYAQDHVIELDRAQARMRYPRRPLLNEDAGPVLEPPTIGEGDDRRPNPRAGELVMAPSPLDSLTEADWERAGHVLRLPEAPSTVERVGAVFDLAMEQAEEELYRLLALFTIPNADVKALRREGRLDEELDRRADELVDDGGLEELLELAVVIGEVIDDQFRSKADELGKGRLGNALRLLGIDLPTSSTEETPEAPQTTSETPQTTGSTNGQASSSSRPLSSSDSDARSDGSPTPPSTPTTDSSSTSSDASTSSSS